MVSAGGPQSINQPVQQIAQQVSQEPNHHLQQMTHQALCQLPQLMTPQDPTDG